MDRHTKSLVRRFYKEAVNTGVASNISDFFAPDCDGRIVEHGSSTNMLELLKAGTIHVVGN